MAPGPQKMAALHLVFWPKALHGSPNCLISHNYALELRKQAVKALRLNGAGSNPLLRLTLSDNFENDPGFYQIKLSLTTFRRLLRKNCDLLPMWATWMQSYNGKDHPGPFSQFVHCLGLLGWTLTAPPWIQDHEQRHWNLITVDQKTFTLTLQDAWLQHVAASIRRKTMTQMNGLDGTLTRLDYQILSALDRSRLSALQSGAFLTSNEHARYDPEKTPMCCLCGQEDDRKHWLTCPRFHNYRQMIPFWDDNNVTLPDCMVYHLLVPRLDTAVNWRQHLWQLEDRLKFSLLTPPNKLNHLFLDGSCTNENFSELNYAAWAVVNATTCEILQTGHLSGLAQSIDRAELTAMVHALAWTAFHQVATCIWSDSLSTVTMARRILETLSLPDDVANYDLWSIFLDSAQQCTSLEVLIRWVPSHLDPAMGEDMCEDWLIHWNDRADVLAGDTNVTRPANFWALRNAYAHDLTWWSQRVRQLRSLFFLVAEDSKKIEGSLEDIEVIESSDDEALAVDEIVDLLPINWMTQCRNGSSLLPGNFITALVQWMCISERGGSLVRHLTELELVFALHLDRDFHFVYQLSGNTTWVSRSRDSLFQTPTFTMLLRPVQMALQFLHELFPQLPFKLAPQCDPKIGIVKSFPGLYLRMSDDLYMQTRQAVAVFTQTRPVRRAADLARPA